ncbi:MULTISPECIES: ribose-phosphate pyrophosphokinase [Planococcus]|uniref:Ribose-phosphate pyrophosphokinase n=1 Tax=Planococcus faecalis TaxID=1598147 RepID=A0ABM6IVZ6_9BACL|nr:MULTISPECIES: ribose-phosphate pyrophosphokinase [Planococcus]AQU80726.1 ribose-phosphate pyrophosphokinase [Planococcus faecalis]MDJ0331938.1 ribose-phosphate pyrophosphokinase [Planococcus sp. S3-L1]OHX55718.1 ribose-phosphate pyrophosphokinase [Planococcus faecalis]
MAYQLGTNFKLFTLNSNPELTQEIADLLGCEMGKSAITHFSDGEVQIHIQESVRGADVYVVQSTSQPGSEHVMELLIMIDALKRASVKTINVVIPYYGYARQDRKASSREPITAKLVANMLEKAGATHVITMDLHAPQIQGFFNIPVDQLLGGKILEKHFLDKGLTDAIVVAPDNGGLGRARKLASHLDVPIGFIDKRRMHPDEPETVNIVGDIKGKNVIIIVDIIDTATTISLAANVLVENGAKAVYACCTHAVLSGQAVQRIQDSAITELVVTNTIYLPEEKRTSKINILSVAPLLAEAIEHVHNEKPVTPLFE